MLHWLVHAIRRRIAVKLTLTLVGFVAVTVFAAGIYLKQALERLAIESMEARLATAGRLLEEDALTLLVSGAPSLALQEFALRASRPTASRLTLIAPDGRVLADSSVAFAELGRVENHGARAEVRAALEGRTGRARLSQVVFRRQPIGELAATSSRVDIFSRVDRPRDETI